ncbi:NR2C2 protein, partial [Polypterus senegalus]
MPYFFRLPPRLLPDLVFLTTDSSHHMEGGSAFYKHPDMLQVCSHRHAPVCWKCWLLLLRLPALRLMSAAITEELFFAGLIGNVQIDSIIPYILKMETADYNSQIIGSSG